MWGTAAGYMKTIHHRIIYHKIIDSEEGEELYWLPLTRLDKEKSHTAAGGRKVKFIRKGTRLFFGVVVFSFIFLFYYYCLFFLFFGST